jgi:hypothetical protein
MVAYLNRLSFEIDRIKRLIVLVMGIESDEDKLHKLAKLLVLGLFGKGLKAASLLTR